MRSKLILPRALVVATLSGVLTAACQTYDFEPVAPLAISQTTEARRIEARASKPNLMLLVDTSGSMTSPVNPDLPACKLSNGDTCSNDTTPCDTTKCPTRWSDLQGAMSSFLTDSSTIARIGLTTFPDTAKAAKGDDCGASSSLSVPFPASDKEDDATLTAKANEVKTKLLSIKNSRVTASDVTPTGGTPTALSLQYVGGLADLQGEARSDFVILLTDGLPNCNAKYPTPYPNAGCFCILASGNCTGAEQVGCLDTDASVAAVQQLRAKNIQTIVIGFGTDFKTTTESGRRGTDTLNGMAVAGGFSRKCSTDAQCGTNDACVTATGLCKNQFYQAGNKADLVTALKAIAEKVVVDKPCELRIPAEERPSKAELVVVYLNGDRLSAGPDTWTLQEPGIVFLGSTCARIEASSPSSPANIEVRAVQTR